MQGDLLLNNVLPLLESQPDRYTIWSNFQGPFILHALMSGALNSL